MLSELIDRLQCLYDRHGDRQVEIYAETGFYTIEDVILESDGKETFVGLVTFVIE